MSFYSLFQERFGNASGSLAENTDNYVEPSSNRFDQMYTGFSFVAAIVAYTFLLIFPFLLLSGILEAYSALTAEVVDWLWVLIWLSISILAAFVCYRSLQIDISGAAGKILTQADAPELFELINKSIECFRRPRINRVVVTGDYELDIRKVPEWVLPVWSSNVLVIGLPVLNCHTPEHVACMVTRRIGQFSKRDNMITNWLYQLRTIWPLYCSAFEKQKISGTELLRWFFMFFTPAYNFISTAVVRKDELNADRYAMDVYNHEIVREMISADTLYRYHLLHNYWPAVERVFAISPKSRVTPYAKMASSVRNRLNKAVVAELLAARQALEYSSPDDLPSLKSRLANIGHKSPHMKLSDGDTAAAFYLGTSLMTITDEIDRQWLAVRSVVKPG